LGEPRDGAIMLVFVIGIISIDIIQEWKTDKTLLALKDLSAPQITVYRDGREQEIASADLVPGDVMLITEGVKIPADGYVIRCNDLCTDESSLTGEAEGVWKQAHDSCGQQSDSYWRKDYCYAGTMVIQGSALIAVDKIAMATEYGKIGAAVSAAPEEPTPLQKQTGALVKTCAIIAAVLFLLVGVVTYLNVDGLLKQRVIESILSGITLSMAMIPEEFPVILTVFLSMGAWRLAKKNSLVRRLPAVETLGAVSVLCVDKTGTITENQMTVAEVWAADQQDLIRTMGLGCEKETYDPMEQAMLDYCQCQGFSREQLFAGELVFEYPFTNALKMMGHLWQNDAELILAAKGSPEQILALTDLSVTQRTETEAQATAMSRRGLRVIAVAKAYPQSAADLPSQLSQCRLQLVGLVGLADPPRAGVADQIALCRKA
ncbi:MAG: HAD-IC family P-type ATPase, partial [Clostridiales bacterium]